MKREDKKYNVFASLSMARHFYSIGRSLLLPDDNLNKDPYAIFVSGANIAFSLELYLKSFILVQNKSLEKNHSLEKLYSLLDKTFASKLNTLFQEKINDKKGNKLKTLFIRGKLKEASPSEGSILLYSESKSLDELLKKHSKMFTSFRYMFESGTTNDYEHFIFEYESIDIFVSILEKIIQEAR